MPCLQAPTVESLSADTYLPMLRQLESYFVKAVVMNESLKYKIHQVGHLPQAHQYKDKLMIIRDVDCPEREATYIITNGGINDQDKIWKG